MTELVREADLEGEVNRVRNGASPEALVAHLREDAPMYRGRSTGATGRVRGWVLASFAELGLPESALPFVLEELEFGTEPYPVAGSARALRGHRRDADVAGRLVESFRNLRSRDEPVSFDSLRPQWPAAATTSALREILATAAWLDHSAPTLWRTVLEEPGSALEPAVRSALERLARSPEPSSCCGAGAPAQESVAEVGVGPRSLAALAHLEVEDHEGASQTLGSLLNGRPTVLTFFYTRCENPNKCAATIARLGLLQAWLADQDRGDKVRILGLTYDPEYDSAARLRRYTGDLGLRPAPLTTIGRTPDGIEELRSGLALGVGRGGATVNRHAVEVFVLDGDGKIVAEWSRVGWEPADVGRTALAFVRERQIRSLL